MNLTEPEEQKIADKLYDLGYLCASNNGGSRRVRIIRGIFKAIFIGNIKLITEEIFKKNKVRCQCGGKLRQKYIKYPFPYFKEKDDHYVCINPECSKHYLIN